MISHTTKEFWNLFDVLPKGIQNQAVKAYEVWNSNPSLLTNASIPGPDRRAGRTRAGHHAYF